MSDHSKAKYYKALIERKTEYDGVFYVGVKTTGIFCRPSCPARKPKIENCEFFKTAKEALIHSYRPCKRCVPLLLPNTESAILKNLINAIEGNPEKKWKNSDLKAFEIDASTARRQFQKRYGMTFIEYARMRRMNLALSQLKNGGKIIDSQILAGYESSSGFREAFTKIIGTTPSSKTKQVIYAAWINTVLGPMVAVSDEFHLLLLEFVDRRGLEKELLNLKKKLEASIIPNKTKIISQVEGELALYFSGDLIEFKTPILTLGSPFQESVWQALINIPYGETTSYGKIAKNLNKNSASRAIAQANGANQLSIIIPCHRVINSNGELGGYGGGISRKSWLIEHERKHSGAYNDK